MASELEQLEARKAAIELEIQNLRERDFCNPANVNIVLQKIAKALGGVPVRENMSLPDLADAIESRAKDVNRLAMEALWPKPGYGEMGG